MAHIYKQCRVHSTDTGVLQFHTTTGYRTATSSSSDSDVSMKSQKADTSTGSVCSIPSPLQNGVSSSISQTPPGWNLLEDQLRTTTPLKNLPGNQEQILGNLASPSRDVENLARSVKRKARNAKRSLMPKLMNIWDSPKEGSYQRYHRASFGDTSVLLSRSQRFIWNRNHEISKISFSGETVVVGRVLPPLWKLDYTADSYISKTLVLPGGTVTEDNVAWLLTNLEEPLILLYFSSGVTSILAPCPTRVAMSLQNLTESGLLAMWIQEIGTFGQPMLSRGRFLQDSKYTILQRQIQLSKEK